MHEKPTPRVEDDEVADLLRLAGPRHMPPEERRARVRGSVRAEWQQAVQRHRGRRLKAWAGVALASAAACVLVFFYTVPRSITPPVLLTLGSIERVVGDASLMHASAKERIEKLKVGGSVPSEGVIRTGADGIVGLRLANGTSVRLDSSTELRLLDNTRLALEQGAVYVDSGSDAGSEVEVLTPMGTARDIGTRFEVRLVGPVLRVRVRDGRVRLDAGGLAAEAVAGWELTRSGGGEIARRAIALSGADWDWAARAAAPFPIEGQSLGAFLQWIEREGGWRMKFADPVLERSASRVILHGSIEGLTPADALNVVLPTCGLTHRRSGDTVIVETLSAGGRP